MNKVLFCVVIGMAVWCGALGYKINKMEKKLEITKSDIKVLVSVLNRISK